MTPIPELVVDVAYENGEKLLKLLDKKKISFSTFLAVSGSETTIIEKIKVSTLREILKRLDNDELERLFHLLILNEVDRPELIEPILTKVGEALSVNILTYNTIIRKEKIKTLELLLETFENEISDSDKISLICLATACPWSEGVCFLISRYDPNLELIDDETVVRVAKTIGVDFREVLREELQKRTLSQPKKLRQL